jgi:hypothetical protein
MLYGFIQQSFKGLGCSVIPFKVSGLQPNVLLFGKDSQHVSVDSSGTFVSFIGRAAFGVFRPLVHPVFFFHAVAYDRADDCLCGVYSSILVAFFCFFDPLIFIDFNSISL